MSDVGVFGVPRRPADLVPRPALEARLDGGAMVTTVVAGAGFGKTTLVSTWAADWAGAGVWVDGAVAGGDRASFWRAVFAVVADAATATGASVLRDAAVPAEGVQAGDDVSAVVARFARSLTEPFLLVLDGAEALDLEVIADDLVALVRLATSSRLVVVDRRRRFRPTLLASDVDETVLTGADLAFSAAETAQLVAALSSRTRDRARSEELHRSTDGIVGLARRLAVSGAKDPARGEAIRDLVGGWERELHRSLEPTRSAAASGVGSPVASALMIAALGAATIDEAVELTGLAPTDARLVLDAAADRGMGSWRDGGTVESFAFAPIVARCARAVLTDDRDAPERRRIAARFARLFARRGDAASAFGLAIDAEDFDLAIAIGKRSFLGLVRDDTPGLLRRLKRVPLTRLRRHPLLVLFIAMLHMQSPRGLAAAMLHFRLAEQLARATEATAAPDDRAVMVGVRSAAARMQGRFDKSVPLAREFLERFDRLTPEEQDRVSSLSRHFLWQVAHSLLFAGDTAAATGAAQRMLGVPVPAHLEEDRGVHPALTFIAAVQAIEGDVVGSRETLDEALTHPPRPSAFYHVWGTTAAAIAAIERGEFAAARRLVDELDHDMAAGEYWPLDLVVRMSSDVAEGRLDAAIDRMNAPIAGTSPRRQALATRDALIVLSALLSLAGRPSGTASGVLRHVSRPGPLRWLAESVIALREGENLKAVGLARNAIGDSSSPRVRAAALLVRAAASAAADQRDAAARAAQSALELMEATGLATPWLLLTAAEREEIRAIVDESAISRELRASLGRMPAVFGADANVERLTVREQEVLAHLVAGTTIPEIARTSGVSPNTVKTQRARIYRKLGVDNRTDAARVALEHDLL